MSEEQPQLSYHGRSAPNLRRDQRAGEGGPNLDAARRRTRVARGSNHAGKGARRGGRPYNPGFTCEKLADLRS